MQRDRVVQYKSATFIAGARGAESRARAQTLLLQNCESCRP